MSTPEENGVSSGGKWCQFILLREENGVEENGVSSFFFAPIIPRRKMGRKMGKWCQFIFLRANYPGRPRKEKMN
jgi:hypothetical protein